MIGFANPSNYLRARDLFQDADYTTEAIRKRLGRDQILTIPFSDLPLALRHTASLSKLDTLIRLFLLGVPVPVSAARCALAPIPLDSWVQGELLSPTDSVDQLVSRVQFTPVGELVVAADMPRLSASGSAADFVMPPGPITLELSNAMVQRPCAHTLDLGAGCGLLALQACRHSDRVIASDMNKRAIEFTRLNALLNGVDNVQAVAGNLFEPVVNERFDRIICNPPFVISPTGRFMYRDSGLRGDHFCRRLLESAMNHLEVGGFFQFTANLAHETGRSWKSSLEEWFDSLGCNALALIVRTEDVSVYAMSWILTTETQDGALVPKLYDTWMEYYNQQQIEAISYMLITVQRSEHDSGWLRIEEPPCDIAGPCGDEMLHLFETREAFGSPSDGQQLLSRYPRLAPNIEIERKHVMTPHGPEVRNSRILKTGGLQYAMGADDNVVRLLIGCDGNRTLRQLLEDMAACLQVDFDRLVGVVLPVVQSLVERSVLLALKNPHKDMGATDFQPEQG